MDEVIIKSLISASAPVVTEPVKIVLNTWLKPKIEKLMVLKDNKKIKELALTVFSDYLTKTYEEHLSVNVIALGLQQININQVYIPLQLYSQEKKETIQINGYDNEFATKYKKIVIEDAAGMGKSTLMKKMFISCVEDNVGIPIFVDLKYLSDSIDIIDVIIERFDYFKINPEQCRELIINIIQQGDFIFFLDGYDEISFRHKQTVTYQLKQFIVNAGRNVFFLTSRPDDSLYSFGQFQKFSISGFSENDAYNLFKKYDNVTQLSLSNKAIEQIQDQLSNESFGDLESFLENPLLASFLYLTYKHKMDLPTIKIEFYEKVYDALYELHDLSKDHFKREKYSGLSKRNLQKILMHLGFLCLKENNNEYDKNKLLQLISQVKSGPYYQDVDEENILKDLLETVPLFTRVGTKYKWSHKSFMEYFSAYHIEYHEKREGILTKISESNNFSAYRNMLDFYYDINRKMFDRIFVYPLITKFIEFVEENKVNYSIEYLEIIFNNIIIFDKSPEINEIHNFDDVGKALGEKYSDHYPGLGELNFALSSLMQFDTPTYALVYFKSISIRQRLYFLHERKSDAVRAIPYEKMELPFEYELIINCDRLFKPAPDPQVENLHIKNIIGVFGATNLLTINYQNALKLKDIIEQELNNIDDDLFSIF